MERDQVSTEFIVSPASCRHRRRNGLAAALLCCGLILLGISAVGCNESTGPELDDTDNDSDPRQWYGTMTASVDGHEFIAEPGFVVGSEGVLLGERFISLLGGVPNGAGYGESISLLFRPSSSPVTFGPGSMDGGAYGRFNPSDPDDFQLFGSNFGSGHGTLTLSRNEPDHIAGTFAFTAVDSMNHQAVVSMTEGEFDVTRR